VSDAKNGEGKKKLRLLNEVLPAPSPVQHERSPRERTMSRLRHLAGAAAVIGVSVSACGKPEASGGGKSNGEGDAGGNPNANAGANADANAGGNATADASASTDASADGADASAGADAGRDAGKVSGRAIPPRKDPGYMVVDMMPDPALTDSRLLQLLGEPDSGAMKALSGPTPNTGLGGPTPNTGLRGVDPPKPRK
jgi:hypothetical protein